MNLLLRVATGVRRHLGGGGATQLGLYRAHAFLELIEPTHGQSVISQAQRLVRGSVTYSRRVLAKLLVASLHNRKMSSLGMQG